MHQQASPQVSKGTSWKEKVVSYQQILGNLHVLSQEELFKLEGSILEMFRENNLNVVNKVFLVVKAYSDLVPFTRIAVEEVVFVAFKFAGIKGLSLEPLIMNLFIKNDRKKIMNVLLAETRSQSNSRAIQAYRIILQLIKQYGLKETFENESIRSLIVFGLRTSAPEIKLIIVDFLKFLYSIYGEKTLILLTKELDCEILMPQIRETFNSNDPHASPYQEFPMELFFSGFDFLIKYDYQSLLILPTVSIKSQIHILNEMMEDVSTKPYLLEGDYEPILRILYLQSANNNKATSKLIFQILKNLVEKVRSLHAHSKLVFETLFNVILHKNIRSLIKESIGNHINRSNNCITLQDMLKYPHLKEKLMELATLNVGQYFKHIQFHRAILILQLMLPNLTYSQIIQIKNLLDQMWIIGVYKIQFDHLLKSKLLVSNNQQQECKDQCYQVQCYNNNNNDKQID